MTLARMRNFLTEEYERAFRHDHWNVGIADVPIHAFLDPGMTPPVSWLPPPTAGRFHADPFGATTDGVTTILFEEYDFRADRGAISWVRELPDGGFSRPRVAIEFPFHAAYPFLIRSGGEMYCIPDIAESGEIAAYRAIEFPGRWVRAATLVKGLAGLDSTVIENDGMYWLFCTDLRDGGQSKLRLWYARDLLDPWTPHPRNPVKTDSRSARSAGTPFHWKGELYRPAQDCSRGYGGSVTINRIDRLTTTQFHEEPVATVGPFRDGPYSQGVHTLSAIGDRTLVDGKRFAFNASEMARHLRESVGERWPRMLQRA